MWSWVKNVKCKTGKNLHPNVGVCQSLIQVSHSRHLTFAGDKTDVEDSIYYLHSVKKTMILLKVFKSVTCQLAS
jgi:hypothetical protein